MDTNGFRIDFQSTPQLWMATRDGLCWCEECSTKNDYGLGKTPAEALAHLIEQELDKEMA